MMSWKMLECPVSTQSHRDDLDPIRLSSNQSPISCGFLHVADYKDIHAQ